MIANTIKGLCLLFFFATTFIAAASPAYNVSNVKQKLPPKFRMCDACSLQASGSAQFSEEELVTLLSIIKKPCIIIDLREEPHGFVNGICVNGSLKEGLDGFITEKSLVEFYGLNYFYLGVPDGGIPSSANVKRFIDLICSLNRTSWLHFHCAAGRGRTTQLLAMYDMLLNAKHASFNEIIRRQHFLGGVNLLKIHRKDAVQCKKRVLFLKKFYFFCRNNDVKSKEPWFKYIQKETNQARL